MKKVYFILLLSCVAFGLKAQNVQFHYDFGHTLYDDLDQTRPKVTTTVEMFKPDKWGSTFFFVDMDYTSKGVQAAYWEISRELKFWEGPISAHIEYDGGRGDVPFQNAYLFGPTYTFNNKDFSAGFSVSAMYKYIENMDVPSNYQLTGTWYVNFCDAKCTFSGFADLWREKEGKSKMIFLSEPQFWVNLNKFSGISKDFNLSIGTEVEFSNNFIYNDNGERNGFYVNPTLAMKWTF